MKTKARRYHPGFILSFAALLASLPAMGRADDATPPPPSEHRRERGPDMERLAADLGLSDDQKAKWKAINEQERAEMEALRADTSVAKEDKRAKGMEIHKKYRDLRDAVLTPEQKAKADKMREEMMSKRHGDKGGSPSADQK